MQVFNFPPSHCMIVSWENRYNDATFSETLSLNWPLFQLIWLLRISGSQTNVNNSLICDCLLNYSCFASPQQIFKSLYLFLKYTQEHLLGKGKHNKSCVINILTFKSKQAFKQLKVLSN